ncbi:aminotransferase class I/II-fold pyridoxal phosphate-dependent enzyme [Arsenicibacter rosenii]|uniref:Aminotransferase class I/classII large domain-containing protein n=1 Tax=Arsenicibacter rosenii TaxID=1750698 RepID=A0A1S2VQH1_9BACT|nr:aminotransferase class I/II-fold pyridoxal phosphate-dependent enzyme [Arsenicibacter rosenii]OIN60426.1 hypothetical protein BLX24_06290 [Arsenicibacter rosenii]
MNTTLITAQYTTQHDRPAAAWCQTPDYGQPPADTSFSLPGFIRKDVFKELAARLWKGHSSGRRQFVERRLSDALGRPADTIVLGDSVVSLLGQLLDTLSSCIPAAVVVKPSVSVVRELAEDASLAVYEWPLTDDFGYHEALFPELPTRAVVVLAAPDPVVGAAIPDKTLLRLLAQYPDNYFVIDESHALAPADSLLAMTRQHTNLILLRSFTVAGTTLGYAVAETALSAALRANLPAFSLSHVSELVLDGLLTAGLRQECLQSQLNLVAQRRNRFYEQLNALLSPTFQVTNTRSNFVLISGYDRATYQLLLRVTESLGLVVRDLHQARQVRYTIQIPVRRTDENDWLVNRLAEAMAPFDMLLFM